MKRFQVKHRENGLVFHYSINELLEIINADRSDEWIDYDIRDWREGLIEWTPYTLVEHETISPL